MTQRPDDLSAVYFKQQRSNLKKRRQPIVQHCTVVTSERVLIYAGYKSTLSALILSELPAARLEAVFGDVLLCDAIRLIKFFVHTILSPM
jgi:hypothetical protein